MLLPCFTVVQIPEDSAGDSCDVAAIAGGVCGAVGFLASSLSSSLSSGRDVVRIYG